MLANYNEKSSLLQLAIHQSREIDRKRRCCQISKYNLILPPEEE